ncbi:polysaccharide biosynthesis/export family protein [Roseibacillus persicicus]|uniref:Capsular polysaccharide biosynthesis protein n=1 Tax=Roseibacillus persicicus TaxID=454148 RepID=A0A918TF67_9BACT|nr:polysaccharide biosynthesis/export family protein [Roseibacillus persicicus]GHC43687.1 capsular polysaccharide biosynthesis protein [Roseibacillus persicicus]
MMKTLLSLLILILFSPFTSAQNGQAMSGLISSTDTVRISVHREPDLDTAGQLASDGTLSMPLIGAVKLSGRTTTSAESLIEAKLKDGYLVRPQVTVRITQRQVQTVSVGGEVASPGIFTLPHNQPVTLSQVINMAGGATDIANIKKVTLRRASSGKVYTINLKEIIQGAKKDIVLVKGDSINVPEGLF